MQDKCNCLIPTRLLHALHPTSGPLSVLFPPPLSPSVKKLPRDTLEALRSSLPSLEKRNCFPETTKANYSSLGCRQSSASLQAPQCSAARRPNPACRLAPILPLSLPQILDQRLLMPECSHPAFHSLSFLHSARQRVWVATSCTLKKPTHQQTKHRST